MKRFTLFAAAALLVPAAAEAQSNQMMIERALAAAPARAQAEATVVRFNADHTWQVIKQGSNTWMCYDRSGEPGRAPFAVQCTSLANLERVAQNRRFAAEAADRQALRAMVSAADADGTRVPAEFGSLWRSMNGQDMESASVHVTIAVPGATGASTGMPTSRSAGGAYIMAAGTSEAHIMVPG